MSLPKQILKERSVSRVSRWLAVSASPPVKGVLGRFADGRNSKNAGFEIFLCDARNWRETAVFTP
tara:strand:+ start:237 stop:431 length:195 start_codon:yes stop_codon:yes gene_type:complete